MENPYNILRISQNASKKEIQKAFHRLQVENRKVKRYSGKFILLCQRILMDPSKRLAADYLFPTKLKSYRPKRLKKLNIDLSRYQNAENILSTLDDMIKSYEKK